MIRSLAVVLCAGMVAQACHESPHAAVAQVVDLTDAWCSLAPASPVDSPMVEVVCSLVETAEGAVAVIVGDVVDSGILASKASIKSDHVLYQFPLPRAAAPAFLAAHHRGSP